MYSYFTHPAELDNFMPLSPQLAWPANQCPLKRQSVHMSLDPFTLILLLRKFPPFPLHEKHYNCSVCHVHALQGCYRQMLIMTTPLPPVISHCTDNESAHLCSVAVATLFLNLYLFNQGLQSIHTFFFPDMAELHTRAVSQLHTWMLSIVTSGLYTEPLNSFAGATGAFTRTQLLYFFSNGKKNFHSTLPSKFNQIAQAWLFNL